MSKEIRKFLSPDELGAYLSGFGIPISKWGKENAKAVSHLFRELEDGDTELVEEVAGQLIRRVCFVNIEIMGVFNGQLHRLIEEKQVFDEGMPLERVRYRQNLGGAVKEKTHLNEEPSVAASRALFEELGIVSDVSLTVLNKEEIDRESPSYPGLRTQYRATYFEAELNGDQIKPEGYKEVELDKTTYFIWQVV